MTVSLFAPTHDEVRTGREGRVCGYVRSDVDKQTTRGDGSEEGEMTEVGGGWRVTRQNKQRRRISSCSSFFCIDVCE